MVLGRTGRGGGAELRSLWRHRDFMLLWSAQTISVFGSQFTFLALPLIAVTMLEASPTQMGLLSAFGTSPFLLIGLFAGVWVDRWKRRPILVWGDIGRAAVLITLPVAVYLGVLSMPLLYAGALIVGVLTVFFDVAWQAYLPSLIGRARLVEGNAKLEASRSTSQVGGPGLAGAVIQLVTAPVAVLLDAASFLVSAMCIGLIHQPEPASHAARASLVAEAREGLGVVLGNPMLRAIAGCTGTSNFFSSASWALLILFATRDLGLQPASLGAVFTVGNLGALAGAVIAGPLARAVGVGRVIVAAPIIAAVSYWPIVVATPRLAILMLTMGLALGAFANPIYNINQVSLRQALTPHRLQGRMNATMRFLVWGTMPLGGLFGGALGEWLGLRSAIALSAGGAVLAFVWVWRSPVWTLERIPEPVE